MNYRLERFLDAAAGVLAIWCLFMATVAGTLLTALLICLCIAWIFDL